MDNTGLLFVIILAIVAVVGIGWWYARKQKTERLQNRFGPEYDRVVSEAGERGRAEQELAAREKRVEKIALRDLGPAERDDFAYDWSEVQSHFVDDPRTAIVEADELVALVMSERGYPVGDFDQRAADISVDHPHFVEDYRAAHAIAGRSGRNEASTEELRVAMVHYRSLFSDLLGEQIHGEEAGDDRAA